MALGQPRDTAPTGRHCQEASAVRLIACWQSKLFDAPIEFIKKPGPTSTAPDHVASAYNRMHNIEHELYVGRAKAADEYRQARTRFCRCGKSVRRADGVVRRRSNRLRRTAHDRYWIAQLFGRVDCSHGNRRYHPHYLYAKGRQR